jgi:hypothetical protein
MKEAVLARRLAQAMRLNKLQSGSLNAWNDGQDGRGSAGCLGDEVQRVARNMLSIRVSLKLACLRAGSAGMFDTESTFQFTGKVSRVSLAEIDGLLDELACHSPFSQLGDGKLEGYAYSP